MQQYDSYKDSGVQWLGEIPSHWEVIKTSRVFTKIGSGTTPESGREDYYSEDGFHFLQTGDLNDAIINDTAKKITEKALRDKNLKIYPQGSLVVAMYGATIGKLGLLDIDTTVNQACCVLAETNKMFMKFAFYVFSSAKRDLIFQCKGGGQPNISQDTIRNEKIPVPPLSEQSAIAAYLDEQTAKIDTAIAQQQKMIDLLNERKQIIINRAVTKGLNPNVKMKDSGVEWIGKVPEHWEVSKYKFHGSIKSGDAIRNEDVRETGSFSVWGGNGHIGYCEKSNIEKNAIVIGRVGALCGNVRYVKTPVYVSDNALIFNISSQIDHYFLLLSMEAADFNKLNVSNAQPLITGTKVKNVQFALPPKSEQKQIVLFVQEALQKIGNAISNATKQIALLQERKQIIINDVVTGKVKV